VAAPGLRAMQASYRSLRNMADGLEKLLGEPA
jgi:molybdenum-dependent DNA-binding transcriptional regulator ModE